MTRLISRSDKVGIVTHIHPDGDAIGSSIGMKRFIKNFFNKECRVITATPAPYQLEFLISPDDMIVSETECDEAYRWIAESDLIFCMDLNEFSRTGEICDVLKATRCPRILIDHHPNPDENSFDVCFSTTEISSASELTYWILMNTGEINGDVGKLPREISTALMTGMTTDTNNFGNSVFPSTLEMCAGLLSAGTDREMILQNIYNSYSEGRIRTIGHLLGQNLKITKNGLAYMILDKETQTMNGLRDGDLEGVVNMPLSIKDVKISIFLREDEGFYRVSIRSKRGYSANRLARDHFNGGGHEQAAGGKLFWPGDIPEKEDAGKYILANSAEYL